MRTGSLVAVGSGIAAVAHVTLEARSRIEQADKLLYCVADAVTEAWLHDRNPTAENLYVYYGGDRPRLRTYEEMVQRTMHFVRRGLNVCLVFYGHPGVFVHATHEAIATCRDEGYPAEMLAGVSAEDCLYADLGIDPGAHGCQMYEATDFLVRRRMFDPRVPLILWQAGIFGEIGFDHHGFALTRLPILVEALQQAYGEHHDVVIYEAAMHPIARPRTEVVRLSALTPEHLSGISTLFVPPIGPAEVDWDMLARLDLGRKPAPSDAPDRASASAVR
jgi:hypothetical protein